jgi:acetyl esterase/lipase
MRAHRAFGPLLIGMAVVLVLAACSSGAAVSNTSQASAPGSGSPETSPPSPNASPAVAETDDITYGPTGGQNEPNRLDVYAPTKDGPWPVVVMFHGGGLVSKDSYVAQASAVAAQGFVVFVPTWAPRGTVVPTPAQFKAYASEGACAVAFARSHAAEYGGDPSTLILFGHSAGANLVGRIAFTRPAPTPGCSGGTSLGRIQALVVWDGDWTLTDPSWEDELQADRSASWNIYTPIAHLKSDRTVRVVLLASGSVGPYERDLSDRKERDAFFSLRDPSGALQRQLVSIGALDDNAYDIQETQQLFYSRLKAQGNRVSLTELPGTGHDDFGSAMREEGMSVFVSAFKEAAKS